MNNSIKSLLAICLLAIVLADRKKRGGAMVDMQGMKVQDLLATGKQVLIDVQKMNKIAELQKFAKGGMIIYYFDEQKQLRIYALPLDKPMIKFFDRIRRLKGKKEKKEKEEKKREEEEDEE